MIRKTTFGFLCMAGLLLANVGCESRMRKAFSEHIQVYKKSYQTVEFKPQGNERRIRIRFQNTLEPVQVYLVLERDREELLERLRKGEPVGKGFLARSERVKEAGMAGVVPAGQGFAVVVVNADNKWASMPVFVEVYSG